MKNDEQKYIPGGGTGNVYNEYNIDRVANLNPYAKTVINTDKRPQAFRITEIINCLDERAKEITQEEEINLDLFYIDQKVAHNGLKRWADDVQEFTPYYGIVNSIYAEFDKQGCNKSKNVLKWLKNQYRKLQGRFCGDELFDELHQAVCLTVSSDHHLSEEVREEDLDYDARIVLVDAFIKCEIFEKPVRIC